MTADAQVYADYSAAIPPSAAVAFFRATPRWPSAPPDFDFSTAYLIPVALTAALPLAFAAVVVVLLIVHVAVRYTRWNARINHRIYFLRASRHASLCVVPASAALLLLIFVFTSLGLLGNAALNHSANDALDVFVGLVNDLQRTGFTVVNTSTLLRDRLSRFNATTDAPESVLKDIVGDLSRPALTASKIFMLDRYPDVRPLGDALAILVDSVRGVFDVVRRIVSAVYSVIFIVILLLVSAPPLLRIATGSSAPRILSVTAYLLYLFVPALLAWLLVGVLSAVGAAVADVCVSLHTYRAVLRGEISATAASAQSNAFVSSGFVCPDGLSAESFYDQVFGAIESIRESDLANSTLQILLNTSSEQVIGVAVWTANELPQYLNCSAQVRYTGQLEFVACSSDGLSAINGIYHLWVAFIGLSICLSLVVFLSLVGLPVMRALDVWPSQSRKHGPPDEHCGDIRGDDDDMSTPVHSEDGDEPHTDVFVSYDEERIVNDPGRT